MGRKIGIIGANGFVGRQVARRAGEAGVRVTGVVRSAEAARVVAGAGVTPLLVENLDQGSIAALASGLAGCEGVVYTAGVSARAQAKDRTDPQGLVNVIAACQQAGVRKIIFFSGLGVTHYGMNVHCTNPYFLAKLAGEVALFRSEIAGVVFRPSYIFGVGEESLGPLMRRILSEPAIEIPGDGSYRLQPISVEDTARAVLAALDSRGLGPAAFDLVGPEVVSYRDLVERASAELGKVVTIRERPVEDAVRAARTSSYFGMRSHDLACLLCDEVSDAKPVGALVGQSLETLDVMIRRVADTLRAEGAIK